MDRRENSSVSALSALVLLCVFAVGILFVLLGGARGYSRLIERDSQSYDRRTCAQYMVTKLRQSHCADCVELGSFGEGDALILRQQEKGESYLTRIYCHEGWLMELFCAENAPLEASDGEKIMPLAALKLEKTGTLIKMGLTDAEGKELSQFVNMAGEGDAP